jgi:hypothetical protein
MARDPFEGLRLALMQDVLPVGLGALERVRRGGAQELMAAFDAESAGESVERLRQEGEPAASKVRDQLDQVSPGLGNPVMRVEVRDVPAEQPEAPSMAAADPAVLQSRLQGIAQRLQLLEQRLLSPVELG